MSDLEPIQQSRLSEIGQILGQARQEKGMTLEEVSGKTLIRATILRAIEEGDSAPLPEPVYIRGFIRRFGDLVGLNGSELCDSFPWQPSGSVPLSFLTAGNLNEAKPKAQPAMVGRRSRDEEVEAQGGDDIQDSKGGADIAQGAAAIAAVPEPKLDGEAGVAVVTDIPLAMATDKEAAGLEPVASTTDLPGPGSGDELPLSESESPSDPIRLDSLAPIVVGAALPEAAELESPAVQEPVVEAYVKPDHDTAHASRAALFEVEDDAVGDSMPAVELVDVAAPVAAQTAVSTGRKGELEATAAGGEVPVSASEYSGVATLPPPPAPVFYREPEQRNPLPWIVAVVVGVLGLGIAVFAFGNRQPSPTLADEAAPVEQVASGENGDIAAEAGSLGGAPAAPAAGAAQAPVAAVPADKVVLELEVKGTEDAWMDVRVDGELQIEGNQVPGFKQRWDGTQEIELATARPDLVWISVNGSKSQPFGQLAEANPVKIAGFKPANAE